MASEPLAVSTCNSNSGGDELSCSFFTMTQPGTEGLPLTRALLSLKLSLKRG